MMQKRFSILAVVAIIAFSLIPATAQKSGPTFDKCFQDNNGVNWLRISSATGAFQLSDCNSVELSGTGTLYVSGGLTLFQFDLPVSGGFLKGRFTISATRADGFVLDSSTQTVVFELEDTKFKGNVCACS